MTKSYFGLQMLIGLDPVANSDWINNARTYHDQVVSDQQVSYPVFPLVRGKRVRMTVNMLTGTIQVIFESQGHEEKSVVLSIAELEEFQTRSGIIRKLIKRVQKGKEVPYKEDVVEEEGGWYSYTTQFHCNMHLHLKCRWNYGKRFSLITLTSGMYVFIILYFDYLVHYQTTLNQ